MLSEKYGRTYHFPFSPGTTSDDRINSNYWEDIRKIGTLVHTCLLYTSDAADD